LRYRQSGEETKDKFPLTKEKECLLTPKLRKPWNGKEEKEPQEMKDMREVMNCPEPEPLVWKQWSPT